VTYLARIPVRSQIQAAGGDDARTQARAQGKKNHMLGAHAGAESMFRHRARIGIVLEPTTSVEGLRKQSTYRHIHPGREIGRRMDNSFHPIERAATANTDGRNRFLAKAVVRQQAARRFHDVIESVLRPPLRHGRELHASQRFGRTRREHDRGLGTTHVHAEIDFPHV